MNSQMRLAVCLLLVLSTRAWGQETVRVKLKWKHQSQFAGYYAAKELGFYNQVGLDVTFQEPMPDDNDMVESVLSGKFQFGITDSSLVVDRLRGKPVVALSAIFQHSPQVLLCKESSGIQNVHDLVGKTIMMESQSGPILAYLKNEGISVDKLTVVPHSYSTELLVLDKVHAMTAYATDEPIELADQGIKVRTLSPISGGIDFYDDVLFTSQDVINRNPKVVSAFVSASLRGWDFALTNPELVAELMRKNYGIVRSELRLISELKEMRRYIAHSRVSMGHMAEGRWQHIAQTYAELGLVNSPVSGDLARFLYPSEPQRHIGPIVAIGYGAFTICAVAIFFLIAQLSHFLAKKRGLSKRYGLTSETS